MCELWCATVAQAAYHTGSWVSYPNFILGFLPQFSLANTPWLLPRPGESLPDLPQPTHALPGAGLLPYNTVANAIDGIPLDAEDHDVEKGLLSYQMLGYREPYNKLQPARTITCSGGEFNYHPSGRRGFTAREFACLQTFPVDFQFSEKKVRKQIGNAVPPKFAEAVFREVCKSLRETDERESCSSASSWDTGVQLFSLLSQRLRFDKDMLKMGLLLGRGRPEQMHLQKSEIGCR